MSELYVKSINGKGGPEKIYDSDPGHTIDATEIMIEDGSSTNIYQRYQAMRSGVRPLYVNQLSENDYQIELPNGI